MRAYLFAAAAAMAFAAPFSAHAQDDASDTGVSASEAALSDVSDKLADPEFQEQISAVAGVLVSSLLDLEVGPIVNAVNDAAGGEGPEAAPDAKLRDLAPDADELPQKVTESLPKAMIAMSAMSEGMADMLPALSAMADKMRDALDRAREAD